MRMICCVDDCMGMMFHDRRQSRDRILIRDIVKMCRGCKLWAAPYSEKMLKEYPDEGSDGCRLLIDDEFLKKAGKEDFCFVEGKLPPEYEKNITQIILYRWNRKYPADIYFQIDLNRWKMTGSWDFTGSSHEKITKEIYEKKEIACASK